MKNLTFTIIILAALLSACRDDYQYRQQQELFWQREELKELERLDSLRQEIHIQRYDYQ